MKQNKEPGKTITKNTLYNAGGKLFQVITGLILIPYIISRIGMDRFGIWAIVGVITGYLGVFDIGIGSSYVKFISEANSLRDKKKINQIITTGILFYSLVSIVLLPVFLPFIDECLVFFNIPDEYFNEAYRVVFISIVLFLFSNILNVFGSVLIATQRMDVSNKIVVIITIINSIGTVFFLEAGLGLLGLIVNTTILVFIGTILNFRAAALVVPGIVIRPGYFSFSVLKEMFTFGFRLQVASIADIITLYSDKLICAYFFNIASVGFYQLGGGITKRLREIPGLLLSAVLPAACDLNVIGDTKRLEKLYFKGSKYLAMLSIPLFLFAFATSKIIMLCWMGKGYDKSAIVLSILSLGFLVNVLSGVGCVIAQSISRADIQMKSALITAVSNILFSIVFASLFGFFGIAVATSLSFLLSCIYFFDKLHKIIDIPLWGFCKKIFLWPLAVSVLLSLSFFFFNNHSAFIAQDVGRVRYLLLLGGEGIVFFFAYIGLLFKVGYVEKDDFLTLEFLFVDRLKKILKFFLGPYEGWDLEWKLRYKPIITKLERKNKNSAILEVGCGGVGISNFTSFKTVGIDLSFDRGVVTTGKHFHPVIGSTLSLPFPDEYFDAVVSVDMMEHIKKDKRQEAISELLRVLGENGVLIIAVPCGRRSEEKDRKLNAIIKKRTGTDHSILLEHLNYGVPETKSILENIKAFTHLKDEEYTVEIEKNVNLEFNFFLQKVLTGDSTLLLNILSRLGLKVLSPFFRFLNIGTCYRNIFTVCKTMQRCKGTQKN